MKGVKFNPLLAVSEKYIGEAYPDISPQLVADLLQIIDYYISDVVTIDRAFELFKAKVQKTEPLTSISAILNVDKIQMDPYVAPMPGALPQSSRKKIRLWSQYEDHRLLCAIHRHGLDNWPAVSQFVGNERTRAQCAQRWRRGLDPRILKVTWTRDEEEKLLELVKKYGVRAWTKISCEFGNRSDVQCRYHYGQMTKASHVEDTKSEGGIMTSSSLLRPKAELIPPEVSQSSSCESWLETKKSPFPSIDEMIGTGRPPSDASTPRKSREDKEESGSTL
jgi:hypothetical protein